MTLKQELHMNWPEYLLIAFLSIGSMVALYNLPIQFFMGL